MERCNREATRKVSKIVSEYGWLSVLQAIALVKPHKSKTLRHDVFTPEYVMKVYETWCETLESNPHQKKQKVENLLDFLY
jgi:hypothetical protein